MKTLWMGKRQSGFTIVELLIVIIVIAILAAITVVAYNGIQDRARASKAESDIASVQRLVEAYNAVNGKYPMTTQNYGDSLNPNWGIVTANGDGNCPVTSSTNHLAQWVPGITQTLPQSDPATGVGGNRGCYIYASNGAQYVLSAWNMVKNPQNTNMYHRYGFREMDGVQGHGGQYVVCNLNAIGGGASSYDINNDYYKHSLTVGNLTGCDETPPAGA